MVIRTFVLFSVATESSKEGCLIKMEDLHETSSEPTTGWRVGLRHTASQSTYLELIRAINIIKLISEAKDAR